MPHQQEDRLDLQATPEEYAELERQWTSGIATEAGCRSVKRPWRFLRNHRDAYNTTDLSDVDEADVAAVKSVLEEIDPEQAIPRLGLNSDVPWPFQGGPTPAVINWNVLFAIFVDHLQVMTDECDEDYNTTCTLSEMIIAFLY